MLIQRVITATIGIPFIVLAILAGGFVFAAVVALAVLIAMLELASGRSIQKAPEAVLAALVAAAMPLAAVEGPEWLLGAVTLAVVLVTGMLARAKEPARGVELWQWCLASAIYLGVLASHFVLLREVDNGRDWLLFAVLTVWIADTGAYFVGRPLGRHKLAPAISPGKTLEGSLGALVTGFASVFLLDAIFELELSLAGRIALGVAIPLVAIIGDLAESAVKRSLGVKDSSGLVPGHGGIADRLDSLLFALPLVYYYVRVFVL